jgi:hypothetical protein
MEGIRLFGERRSLHLASDNPASFNERKPMRKTLRSLADAREELVPIEQEFTQLQKRIEAVRDCVADSLVRLFGAERPALAGLQEEAFIERVAERVVARLSASPKPEAQGDKRYVRDVEAAKYLGVSAATLRSWRSKRSPSGPPVTRMGRMVLYSVRGWSNSWSSEPLRGGKGTAGFNAWMEVEGSCGFIRRNLLTLRL